MAKILVADDDKNIVRLISDSLIDEGFEVTIARNGNETVDKLNKDSFSLVLLDITMPGLDGHEVIRQVRQKVKCPIIFVSARSRTLDTVLGLELGADDYIAKPFVVDELVAKVKAHIRRDRRNNEDDGGTLTVGDITIYPNSYEVTKNSQKVDLTSREFQLLMYLFENLNVVLTREQIFDAVWGLDYSDIGTVTVTIKNLRDKIDAENKHIKTVWGVGYKLCKGDSVL